MEYNETGQLKQKSLHGTVGNGIQNLNYSYNIRGWLEKINNPDVSPTSTQKFNLGLYYNSVPSGLSVDPQYNGNISATVWNTPEKIGALSPAGKQGYGYTYDGLNRLTASVYGEGSGFATNLNANNESLSYDKNGNIKTLARFKKGDGSNTINRQIDQLTYTYKNGNTSNMLDRVDDAVTGTEGFSEYMYPNYVQQANEYGYDSNGNLNRDDNKGYNYIDYNYLNLPWHVGKNYPNNEYITYIYDAAGTKLAKIGTAGNYTWYAGGFVYNGSSLNYILTSEGMWLPGGSYNYYLKDHLGNTRLAVNTSGTVVQQTDYYPFGMDIAVYNGGLDNKYRYNGKEFQEDVINSKSLSWYDYGARFYDPVIGRWQVIDPSADEEGQEITTPYCYVENNPISRNDPDGRIWGNIIGAIVGGGVELAGQAIAQMASGKELSEVDIDWVDVGAATLEGGLTSGGSVLRKVAVTTISAGVQAAFDNDRNIVTGGKSISQAGKEFVDNIATAGVAAGTQKIVNASTKEAVSSANKQVVKANNAVTTAENRLTKHPSSPKAQAQVNNAKANAQTARSNQVRSQVANNTVGKTNVKIKVQKINFAQQTANTSTNTVKNIIVDEKKR